MKLFFGKLKKSVIEFYESSRIPMRDKKIMLVLFLMATLPILFIPEWANLYGLLTSLICYGIIADYLFNILDQTLLLSFYPFNMKSYQSLKRFGLFLASISPSFITNHLWEYKKEII